jgi:hypothetical protein
LQIEVNRFGQGGLCRPSRYCKRHGTGPTLLVDQILDKAGRLEIANFMLHGIKVVDELALAARSNPASAGQPARSVMSSGFVMAITGPYRHAFGQEGDAAGGKLAVNHVGSFMDKHLI